VDGVKNNEEPFSYIVCNGVQEFRADVVGAGGFLVGGY
jgi:hypothetical protein